MVFSCLFKVYLWSNKINLNRDFASRKQICEREKKISCADFLMKSDVMSKKVDMQLTTKLNLPWSESNQELQAD